MAVLSRVLVLACGFALTPWGLEAQGAATRPRAAPHRNEPSVVYASIDECYISRLLSQAECRRAFANANAEFLEKAPSFVDRRACEAVFKACSIRVASVAAASGAGKGAARGSGIEYVPQFSRVKIIAISRDQHEALPVLTNGPGGVPFQPRSVALEDTGVSPARALAAQAAWRKALAPPPRQALRPIWVAPARGKSPGPVDDSPEVTTGPVQTYPVSGSRWNEMQSRIRRNNQDPRRLPRRETTIPAQF